MGVTCLVAWQLVREVLDHAPATLTPSEALVLVALAEYARADRGPVDRSLADIARRARVSPDAVSKAFRRLAGRGLDPRVPIATDRNGAPLYAIPGRVPRYRLPTLPVPDGCECDPCKGKAVQEGTEDRTTGSPTSEKAGTQVGPAGTQVGPAALSSAPLRTEAITVLAPARDQPPAPDEFAVAALRREVDCSEDVAKAAVVELLAATRKTIRDPGAYVRSVAHREPGRVRAAVARAGALDEPCPYCEAQPGDSCIDPGAPGRPARSTPHSRRGHVAAVPS